MDTTSGRICLSGVRALKTGVIVFVSGVLGLGKNDGPDTTLLGGFRVVNGEGYIGGTDDTVADRGREVGACGVGLVEGRDGTGRVGVGWGSWTAFEAFAAASLA
jgi:hypothetical protein